MDERDLPTPAEWLALLEAANEALCDLNWMVNNRRYLSFEALDGIRHKLGDAIDTMEATEHG